MRHYLTPSHPHILYPYTWNAEEIEVDADTCFGPSDRNPYRGVVLLHWGSMVCLYRRGNGRHDAIGIPLGSVRAIRVLKRGNWWELPVVTRR